MAYPLLTGTVRTATAIALPLASSPLQPSGVGTTVRWGGRLRDATTVLNYRPARTASGVLTLPPVGIGPTTGQIWPRTRQG